jgi:GNAT superfamily N-acetyltransferase
MSTVEIAEPRDAPQIFALLKLCYAEDGSDPVDDEKLVEAIDAGIRQDWAMIGVIRAASIGVAASIGLFLDPQWYSYERRVTSRWEFVHPEHRRSDYAKRLLLFAKESATMLHRPLVLSLEQSDKTARKREMMARHMKVGGQVFVFDAPDCAEGALKVG